LLDTGQIDGFRGAKASKKPNRAGIIGLPFGVVITDLEAGYQVRVFQVAVGQIGAADSCCLQGPSIA
jgi:hypothetical protein